MSSCQTRQRYEAELLKKESVVDQMLQSIAKNVDCSVDEAAECIMNVLFVKFENLFADIAIIKDIAFDGRPRKIDIVSAEAILSEA